MKQIKNICLLHGWGGSPEKLKPLEDELKKLGWNTISLKLPFLTLPDEKRPWNTKDFAYFVFNKCQKIFKKKPFYIFGHSNGGRISIKLASLHQDKLKGIILCNTAGISRESSIKRAFFRIISFLFFPIKAIPFLYKPFRKLIYIFSRNYDYYKITSKVKQETFKLLIQENLKKDAIMVKIPVLVLWGTNDKLTPIKDAFWLKNNLPSVTLNIFEGQPHSLPYQKPTDIANLINKWTQ